MCIKTVVNKLTHCMVQLVISVNLFHSCTVCVRFLSSCYDSF